MRCREDLRRARTAAPATAWPSSCCATAASSATARVLDEGAPGVGRPPAARRPARPARAGADADATWRPRCASSTRSTPSSSEIAGRRAWARAGSTADAAFAAIATPHRARADRRDRRLPPLRAPAGAMRFLGLTPSEYSSGHQRHRGHITKTGNQHARRLLIEAAWHYRHRRGAGADRARPRSPEPEVAPAPGRRRSACTAAIATSSQRGKRSTVANVAVARELAGFLWAAMTDQPLRHGGRRLPEPAHPAGAGDRRGPPGGSSTASYAIPTRDPSARQLTTGHCPAVPTRASQSDSRRCRRAGRPTPAHNHHHDQRQNLQHPP